MKKLLIVCGPTVSGKTNLALVLAKKFRGELVSADSRQVYRGMDIGTGKDIPKGFGFRISKLGFKGGGVGYYTDGNTRIWGYDLVSPKEEYSVGQYVKIANKIIKDINKRGKLPILVGGTGLYIKGIVDGIPTASIAKNQKLRKSLERKSSEELFEILAQLDPVKAASMNVSDRKNPRRLVRSIEIANTKVKGPSGPKALKSRRQKPKVKSVKTNALFIGLETPKEFLDKKISERVDKRIKQGFENELRELLESGVSMRSQSMTSLGYMQWGDYARGKKSKDEALNDWKRKEQKYAGRQMAWFRRDKRIKWFDISKGGWKKRVEKEVKKWYISSNKGL